MTDTTWPTTPEEAKRFGRRPPADSIRPHEVSRARPPVTYEPTEALHRTLWRLEAVLTPGGYDHSGYYGYIALPYDDFLAGMDVVGKANGRRFLDVGCGIGTKLVIAWNLGFTPLGIDFHLPYLRRAQEVIPAAPLVCVRAEDFGGYACADVVYSYRPVENEASQATMFANIAAQMRPGALLFTPFWAGPITGCKKVSGDVWRVT